MTFWTHLSAMDLAALAFNALAFVGYRVLQRARAARDPQATLQGAQASTRAAWVRQILEEGNGILGVQALRNAIMGSVFYASNTMFLVLGTLTLTAQGALGDTWSLLDPDGARSSSLAQAKLLLLLLTLLFAFFCFVNAIRLFAHASITIGVKSESPERITGQVDAGWSYQGLGIRCYYFATPILFWLFGALWFAFAGLGAIAVMHRFDRPGP